MPTNIGEAGPYRCVGRATEALIATRRTQTTQQSRELLLAAAAQLFAEQGYRRTTFADIAEKAEISRGSIPWHFGNKEGLLGAVMERLADDMRDVIARAIAVGGPVAVVDRMAEDMAALFRTTNMKLFITLITEVFEPDSPAHAHYLEVHSRLRGYFRDWAASVPLRPGFTPDALAGTLLGATLGIHVQWRLAPDEIDLDELLGTLQTLIRGALDLPAP